MKTMFLGVGVMVVSAGFGAISSEIPELLAGGSTFYRTLLAAWGALLGAIAGLMLHRKVIKITKAAIARGLIRLERVIGRRGLADAARVAATPDQNRFCGDHKLSAPG